MVLSVVVPCYNEKRISTQVEKICDYMNGLTVLEDYEVIVVNDGSKFFDYEPEDSHVRVISYEKNHGKGYAVKTGMGSAKGDYVVFMDCDLATDLAAVEDSLKIIPECDIVVGNRYHKNSDIKRTFTRLAASKCLHLVEQMVLGIKLSDTQCGFKMFKNEVAKKLVEKQKIEGFAFDLEYLYLAGMMQFTVKDIPVSWHENGADSSVNFKKSMRFVTDIFAIRRMYKKEKKNIRG